MLFYIGTIDCTAPRCETLSSENLYGAEMIASYLRSVDIHGAVGETCVEYMKLFS